MKKIIGLDIGGTKCAAIVGTIENGMPRVLSKEVIATAEYPKPEAAMEQLASLLETQIGDDLKNFTGIGISCGGPLDSKKGLVQSPPHLPGWDNVPIVQYFSERFHLPTVLQNDANACAVAEWKFGAGKGMENMVFLTFGTGFGAGLILNGALYSGSCDMAGEVGHIRMEEYGPAGYGKVGSLEGFCSGGGIALLAEMKLWEYKQNGIPHKLTTLGVNAKNIFMLAREGDALCEEICQIVGCYFGKGLAMMIDLLNPDGIVAGSIFARNYDILYPIAAKVVKAEALSPSAQHCKILPAALGESIGDFAALSLAPTGKKGSM